MKKRIKVLKRLNNRLADTISYHKGTMKDCISSSDREYTTGLIDGFMNAQLQVQNIINEEKETYELSVQKSRRVYLNGGH